MHTDNKRQAGYQAAFASKPACDGGVLLDVSFTGSTFTAGHFGQRV
jgi:hypothetical protein